MHSDLVEKVESQRAPHAAQPTSAKSILGDASCVTTPSLRSDLTTSCRRLLGLSKNPQDLQARQVSLSTLHARRPASIGGT